jgi:uncharacterized membrane protein YgdD (TMEM256/DUF423 family)
MTPTILTPTILIAFAGLMGAAGVVLLAAGAHAAPGAGLDGAGQMLLFHAAAVLAAAIGLVVGATLFSGDIAMRALAGHRLFPMAAPTGGMVLIASWLGLGVAGVIALVRAG